MAIVILKNFAPIQFNLKNGKSVVLKGNGTLNTVIDTDLNELKEISSFKDLLDREIIVLGKTNEDIVKADLIKNAKKKQDEMQHNNLQPK